MNKHYGVFWAAVLVLGWTFDLLFWDRIIGVNFVIFNLILVIGEVALLVWNGVKPANRNALLLIPWLAFMWMTLLRQEPLTLMLAYIFALLPLVTFFLSYAGGKWSAYIVEDYIVKGLLWCFSLISSPIGLIEKKKAEAKASRDPAKPSQWKPVLRGLLMGIPILIIFTSLLASADVVFESKVHYLTDKVFSEHIWEYILRFGVIWLIAYVLIGIFLYAAEKSGEEKLIGLEKPLIQPFLGFTEAAVVLGCVIALFITFVLIQFKYFFGGMQNIGVQGYTYSQYARQGFNEMIMVAVFTLILMLGLNAFTRRSTRTQGWIYSGLCLLMTALVIVILVAAFQRISLAIDWHGYSRLRLYPQIFLVWLGVLLAAVAVLEVLHRERYVTLAAFIVSMGFALSLGVFNVDAAIVRHNIERIAQGKHINYPHLASLSIDAVPALVEEFQNPALSQADHESVGAVLKCYTYHDYTLEAPNLYWQVFNFSRDRARRGLMAIQPELASYSINNLGRVRAKTPSDLLVYCDATGEEE